MRHGAIVRDGVGLCPTPTLDRKRNYREVFFVLRVIHSVASPPKADRRAVGHHPIESSMNFLRRKLRKQNPQTTQPPGLPLLEEA